MKLHIETNLTKSHINMFFYIYKWEYSFKYFKVWPTKIGISTIFWDRGSMCQTELRIKSYICSKLSWGIWRLHGNTPVSLLTRLCHSDFFKAIAYFCILHFMVTGQHARVIIDTSVLVCSMTRFAKSVLLF